MSEQLVQDIIDNKKLHSEAKLTATYLSQRFRNNWFDLIKIQKKTKVKKIEDILNMLIVLKMHGFLKAEMRNKVEKYKVVNIE